MHSVAGRYEIVTWLPGSLQRMRRCHMKIDERRTGELVTAKEVLIGARMDTSASKFHWCLCFFSSLVILSPSYSI